MFAVSALLPAGRPGFLHMNLPSKNGLSCLQEIKNNPLLRHLPVVILGANAKRPDIEMAYMLGASQFFIKPFSYTGLRSALNDLLAYNWNEPELIREQFLKGGRYTAFTL
jgi:CheY-like chemotaxis protein